MAAAWRVLAVDVGTSSVKAQLYDEAGEAVAGAAARTGYEIATGRDGRAEADGERLASAVGETAERALPAGERADAVALASFWHSLVAVDATARPLTPLYLWPDSRSKEEARGLREALDERRVHERTGCRLHPSYWPARLLWLRETSPDAFGRARWFLSFADLLELRRGGRAVTTPSLASGTGLYDQERGRWDEELAAATGVGGDRLPELSAEPLSWGDGACANAGSGCLTLERAAVTIGTSAAVRVAWRGERRPVLPALFSYRLDEARPVLGGALSEGGNVVAWLARTLAVPSEADSLVAAREPAAHGLVFLPLLAGERSPTWATDAQGAVVGLSLATAPLDLLQAALEGIAYRLADVLDELAAVVPEVVEIVASGGALRERPAWLQILADVFGRPVTASAVGEASARGAALLALERLGALDDAARVGAPRGRAYEPREERRAAHAEARERQRRLYSRLVDFSQP